MSDPETTPVVADGESEPTAPVQDAENETVETRDQAEKLKRESQRLRNERNKARTEIEALRAELEAIKTAKEREMQDEAQKMIEALRAEKEGLAAEVARMRDLQSLNGKVAHPEAALKLLEAADRNEDGSINVDSLLGRYAFLAPAGQAVTPSFGGGGAMSTSGALPDLNAAIRSGDARAINQAFVAHLQAGRQDKK